MLLLKNIHKVFKNDLFKKRKIAIDHLSCEFPTHKCTGLLGHNGAGKTTTIRLIFGLLKPDKGNITWKNQPVDRFTKTFIGYMPESNKLAASLSCEEILSFHIDIYLGSISKNEKTKLIRDSLEKVGLWSHKHQRAGKLSKGMGRRLAWAQATVHNPDLVILDEPSSGMDPVGRKEMHEWILELKKQGKTILLCTHDLKSVEELCDEFHILNQGKLVYSTLNPLEGQVNVHRPRFAEPMFKLAVSGGSSLSIFCDTNKIKPVYLDHKGHHQEIYFERYQDAMLAIRHCMENGFVITEFTPNYVLQNNTLLNYFHSSP